MMQSLSFKKSEGTGKFRSLERQFFQFGDADSSKTSEPTSRSQRYTETDNHLRRNNISASSTRSALNNDRKGENHFEIFDAPAGLIQNSIGNPLNSDTIRGKKLQQKSNSIYGQEELSGGGALMRDENIHDRFQANSNKTLNRNSSKLRPTDSNYIANSTSIVPAKSLFDDNDGIAGTGSHLSSSPWNCWVMVFGINRHSIDDAIAHCQAYGMVKSIRRRRENWNWILLEYSNELQAKRAISTSNGFPLKGGTTIIGVRAVDSDLIRFLRFDETVLLDIPEDYSKIPKEPTGLNDMFRNFDPKVPSKKRKEYSSIDDSDLLLTPAPKRSRLGSVAAKIYKFVFNNELR